jgi:chemotaxis protein methyltransferase CheR
MLNENNDALNGDGGGFQRIRQWLQERAGIFYHDKKKYLLVYRLSSVCDQFGFSSLDELGHCVESGTRSDVHLAVIDAATTNHTYFFREPQILNYFCKTILPDLPREDVRIWSAASSTGDEAYSIAILAAESRGREWAKQQLLILGTDISQSVITYAEAAVYNASHLERVPPRILEHYFEPVAFKQYQIAEDIRRMCLFRRLNLKHAPYPFRKHFHVVFCRNVLYYFDKQDQKEVLNALHEITAPGGWLLTSVTLSLRQLSSLWIPVTAGVYRRSQ